MKNSSFAGLTRNPHSVSAKTGKRYLSCIRTENRNIVLTITLMLRKYFDRSSFRRKKIHPLSATDARIAKVPHWRYSKKRNLPV